MQNVLLVRPPFPDSRNSVFRIPVGLCKISSWRKSLGDNVYYVEGLINIEDFPYDKIDLVYVTSMFTYWSQNVIDAVNYYKKRCLNAKIIVGGIYASISPDHVKTNSLVDEVIIGVIPEVEKCYPDYSILPTDTPEINDTQIIWTSRGCKRFCDHCYVHVIEPKIYFKKISDVIDELTINNNRKNVLLYDNSIMQHPHLPLLLDVFKDLHKKYGFIYNCTQGIDGQMMEQWEKKGFSIAKQMKKSGFYDLRFSYDWSFQKESVYYCIDKFKEAGYSKKDMQIFVIINTKESPEIIENRYWEIYKLGCQIHSDRFRPGDMFSDNYHKGDTDYFINTEYGWTNDNIRGTLSFMSDLNYATRMGILYTEAERAQKARMLNKGKSSQKLSGWV